MYDDWVLCIFATLRHKTRPVVGRFDWWNINGMDKDVRPNWQDMMEWCVTTLGPSAEMGVWEPGASWYANNGKFWFREEKDRQWFLLKWA